MNKVISREYVEKNYIHKDILNKVLEKYACKSLEDYIVIEFYQELKKLVEETKDEQIQKQKNNY